MQNALVTEYVELIVHYVFAASLSIVHGPNIYTATNRTTGKFNTTYFFPTLAIGRNVNHIWITSVADEANDEEPQMSFSFRYYTHDPNQ